MNNDPVKGLWIILRWTRKPKRLGTGYYWRSVSYPMRFDTARNLLKGFEGFVRIWPANKSA